ncbi:CapA family protein [Oceanobacillus saliphilus]|uniref:CapA family protein n=1 Tax=Oceanobacillus saliphilus TaxID=2925834 RepID=UPI00201E476C|nr:CapA family protein [Oceanobacillus saliphilus]
MDYVEKILAKNENFKITHYASKANESNKCVITFGEIDSTLDDEGSAKKLIMSEGMDYIYVAQKRYTQYQLLSAEEFKNIVSDSLTDKDVYTYGSSLGGYCAIYYGGAVDANILALSPRIPAHPVINDLMGKRFKNNGFYHAEINDIKTTSNKVCIFYDKSNYIDNYFINIFLKVAYPQAYYYHVENAGHYTARALLLSDELKNVALNFFYDKEIKFTLNSEKILEWHTDIAARRVKKGKLPSAQENIEVLLASRIADEEPVRKLVALYKKKLTQDSQEQMDDKKRVNKIYPVMTKKESSQLKDAVSLSFVGDLILLRDQVLNSYNPESDSYEFDKMFSYVDKYIKESDFSMGVLEGPLAGESFEYSTSIYSDRIPLYLNFPDSFADAIKRAGFDFVTTAQNHILDCGVKGAMRTLDVLDKTGLAHRGCYRNQKEKEKLPVFNIRGLKVAILTYTRRSNRYANSFFLKDENKHLTSLLVSPKDENFEAVKQDVLDDFKRIKKEKPDCIIVLPHIGKQFLHSPDNTQKTWCNIFVDAGADIILNDHAHAVQPYEWRKNPEKNTNVLILHCAGNFVNSYTAKDGDASALTQIFLDPQNGNPFAVANVPLWAHSFLDGNYRPLPLYDVIHDESLRKHISTHEFSRIKEIHELITKTMLGENLTIDQLQEKYYLFADRAEGKAKGYVRNPVSPLLITEEMKNKEFYYQLTKSKSVCFIGDSLTEGTRNGGYGWYEPFVRNFKNLKVQRFAKGGTASPYLLKNAEKISKSNSDLYVIAIGINDVRYQDPLRCAMNPKEYIENISEVVKIIRSKKASSKFIFIAPWTSDNYDRISKLPKKERFEMLESYRNALKKYAESSGHLYVDPNPIINAKFKTRHPSTWLKDSIHPNANEGIQLYSWAVLQASPNTKFRLGSKLKSLFAKNK